MKDLIVEPRITRAIPFTVFHCENCGVTLSKEARECSHCKCIVVGVKPNE